MKEEEKNGFKEAKKNLKSLLMIVIIVIICVCIFSASLWFLKRIRTKEDTNNPKNAPGVVRNFMNDTNIDVNGKISSSKSIRQLWEEMRNNGNDILQYLDSAEELAKLIQAAQALDFPDTRENPDEPIDWKNLDLDSTEIQGIVKFKRALEDGNEITMSYVPPSKLQELMNKYMETGKEKDKQEALKHFTIEKTYSASEGASTVVNPLVQETLQYACSWVDKISYQLGAGDKLVDGGKSDCSHFVHRVFGHVGLMEDTLEYFNKYGHSRTWGYGGDNGGCPGTVKIGTDLSKASPGDVLWWHYGEGSDNHVAIYLGNNKTVECCYGEGVKIKSIKKLSDRGSNCQILHFSQFPTDPTGYFDPETMTLHSSLVNSGNIAKVSSLRGMVFLGDSILDSIVNHCSILKNEGAITKYQSGCRPRFFLGEETVRGRRFNWDKEFGTITNPTGFYLLLGQNSCHDKNNRIKEMDKLIQKIKSRYPSAPIYMSSVLYHIDRDGSDKRAATAMNEELKVYCAGQTNVYYSDILRGYNDNLGVMSYDNDHPNKKGSELLINNIKENIIGYSGATTSSASSSSSAASTSSASSTSSSAVTYVNTNIPDSAEYDATNCFSADTQQIINAHRNDFNVNNFKQKMKEAGGYENYVRSLGGVFAKYIDKKDIQVKTAGEFQEIAEYVFGLMTIWGFDYGNGTTHLSWGAKATKDLRASAFYPNGTNSSCFLPKNVNDICGRINNPKMKINCNYGVEMLLRTAGLVKNGELYGEDDKDRNTIKKAKKLIDNKSELQVGDIMYFYRDKARTDWHHSAIVGEVDKQKNVIVLYEFAGRFIEHAGRYKIKVKIDDTKDFGNGYRKNWRGARYFDIDQTTVTANTENPTSGYTSQYQVKVATWNEHQEKVVSTDPEIESYDTGLIHEMTTTMIPYQPIVSKFKMPFNYIYTMLVYGQEKNFAFDLAELVKNSRIEITIHDNVSRTKNVSTDRYTDVTYIHAHADSATVRCMKNPPVLDTTIPGTQNIFENTNVSDLNASSTTPKNRKVEHTSIYNTNYLDIALTLADAWYTRYEKAYTYNEPTENDSTTSNTIGDTVIDEHTENNTLGGLDGKIDDVAKNKAVNKVPGTVSATVISKNNKHADFKTTRINRINTLYMYTKSSSYIPVPSSNSSTVSSITTPKTGSLNKNNWAELKIHYRPNGAFNGQQGFCLVGDDMIACVLHNWSGPNTNRINLIDVNTLEVLDTATGFVGHGNTIAFDPKTEDLIIPGCDGKMNLIHVNRSAKTLENKRKVSNPLHTNDYSTIAYNATHDLFISDGYVFTREAFYSRGKALRSIYRKKLGGSDYHAGCTSYGNQVYYFFSVAPNYDKNYLLITNIVTGKHEETIRDATAREGQGVAFMSDGTLYTCYGGNPTSLWRTDYNYFYDNNIDKSNITPGSGGNPVSSYNTGGVYTSKYGPVSSIGETPKTGQLNKNNFIPLPYKKQPNIQEGFCLVGDNLFAVSMMSNSGGRERSRIYLIDMATFSVCDTSTYLNGHGNSLTYDTVTGDIIYPDKSGTTLIHVNPATKKFENTRKVNTPANDQIAYNKHNDLFITYNCVFTRQQFYSNGKAQRVITHKSPHSGSVPQAQGTYGNQVYFCHSAGNGNYIIVCNILTGKQEKVIYDNTHLEIEEVDFTSDGTMYSIYNGTKESLYKTDYNYFADSDIDQSNVKPLTDNNNPIAMYNTGGNYIDKSSFESIFNSHFNAKTNILSVTDWLFGALEQNSDTKRMVDLTKYLLYRATGNDYGVTTFDFEAYQLEDFNEIGAGTLEGNNTEERVWLALIGAGFNDVAAAAAMGNLSYESGGSDTKTIKTDTVEGGYTEDNGGIGMCQWTNNGRGTEGRNAQLKKYAQSKGTTWKDEKTQIEFLITEITGEGSAKGYANIQFMTKTYDGVTYPKDAMKTVENNQSRIEYATKAFAATFERPAASAFTSSMSKRVELAKHFYSLYNGKRSSLTGNGDILRACEEVIQICLSRNVEYSIDQNKLIYYNIEKCLNEAKYGCCATFTSLALYKSGLLTADQMNKYNCHFTGEGGVPDMLKAAGWRQVQMSEAKAGDVVNDYGNHVLIYAGGDNFYDNRCGIHGKDNEYAATGKIRSGFNNSYRNRSGIQVWRAPGK